ncbi:MAG: ACP S-malonyltransferase [Desulfobacteraceae bacterium]
MKKIAFLFPGQGSQVVGMGLDLYQTYDFVKDIFDQAEEICQLPIAELCFNGPMADLTQTINLQPAVTAVNLACLTILNKKEINPFMCAGHSLGEYSALCAAGAISVEDALKLVFKRGQLMHREAESHKGAMQAIIGLPIEVVSQIVSEIDGVVSVANHNSAQQIVITGAPDVVKKAGQSAKKKGGKVIPLKVSGAWHSDLIKGAEKEFQTFLDTISFFPPKLPIIHNVTADVCADPKKIKTLMAAQLCSPVRWYDTINRMLSKGIEVFVEVGPGKVLSGLTKKIMPSDHPAQIFNIQDLASIDLFIEKLEL